MNNVTEFSRQEKLAEIAREIRLRFEVYDRRVTARTMTRKDADRGIAIMLAIAKDYGGHGEWPT